MLTNFDRFMGLVAGFAPTPEDVAYQMLEIANLHKGERFYDLGSGDGVLLITAVRDFGAQAIGFEIQKKMVKYSRRRIRLLGLEEKIKVVQGDFFNAELYEADVVALYLLPLALKSIRLTLEHRLKPGVRVVTYKYRIKGWKATAVFNAVNDKKNSRIFLYER